MCFKSVYNKVSAKLKPKGDTMFSKRLFIATLATLPALPVAAAAPAAPPPQFDLATYYKGWQGCTCIPSHEHDGFTPRCPVHDAAVQDGDGFKVFEYDCLVIGANGNGEIQSLVAVSAGHAFEEASYEFDGNCVAVRRGQYLYDNE